MKLIILQSFCDNEVKPQRMPEDLMAIISLYFLLKM